MTLYLVLIQLTVLVLLLPLLPEGDDDESHKDVHHEKGDDDDVDDEEDGDLHPVVVDGARVFTISINGFIQQASHPERAQKIRMLIVGNKEIFFLSIFTQ